MVSVGLSVERAMTDIVQGRDEGEWYRARERVGSIPRLYVEEIVFHRQALKSFTDTQTKSTIVNIASVEESREKDDWFSGSEEQRRYG
jgi:hypothetical protein